MNALLLTTALAVLAPPEPSMFYPPEVVDRLRANCQATEAGRHARDVVVRNAAPWLAKSDQELWDLVYSSGITRSWMVWSNGYCPKCREGVPMYNWKMDALGTPWKVTCPHCAQRFPTNDFLAFYRSGLDEHAEFDPARADRTLLFNADHPDAGDPLHTFGVDDGTGYQADGHRWRFIGCYLIYGQWKQAIVGGVRQLSLAYLVTGDARYAHKATVLLDRIADLYPTFNFKTQAEVYEVAGNAGYVSTWHDACEEHRELATAWGRIVAGLPDDAELVGFLAKMAQQHHPPNPKTTWAEIRHNIEDRLLADPVKDAWKIHSNYPRTEVAVMTSLAVLDPVGNRAKVNEILDGIVTKATAVDGMTGEKGLAGYTTIGPRALQETLEPFARGDAAFLADLFQRHPKLRQTWRFHVDTQCLGRYYPQTGDTGSFVSPSNVYMGIGLGGRRGTDDWFDEQLGPSGYSFLQRLYEVTGDPAYVQIMVHANGDTANGLPHDLFYPDPAALQQRAAQVIAEHGPEPKLASVNKTEWHLAILRSGERKAARAAWLDYDSGGGHGHMDGLNLGLFAHGLDLLPEYGYPPVQFGGWGSPRARWYTMTAAHNTVVVDGNNQAAATGSTTLWADGAGFRAVRTDAPAMYNLPQYERSVVSVDISPGSCYLLDVFRVTGGQDHAYFLHSGFGAAAASGLSLAPTEDYGHNTQMRAFRLDPAPAAGYTVDWAAEDRLKLVAPEAKVHLRYTGLTSGAAAGLCESWVASGGIASNEESWLPRLVVRRSGAAPLASTFVGLIEPYDGASAVAAVRRLALPGGDGQVAVEVRLADGRRDVIVATDPAHPLADWTAEGVAGDAELAWVRFGADGKVERLALCGGRTLAAGGVDVKLPEAAECVELAARGDGFEVLAGPAGAAEHVTRR